MYNRYLLDSNILGPMVRKKPNEQYVTNLKQLVENNSTVYLSPVVYYEVKRNLLKKGATAQLTRLDNFAKYLEYRELDKSIWHKAMELWVLKETSGKQGADDADLLIAAQAEILQAIVITNDGGIQQLIPTHYQVW